MYDSSTKQEEEEDLWIFKSKNKHDFW
jgi:hypothetical protein